MSRCRSPRPSPTTTSRSRSGRRGAVAGARCGCTSPAPCPPTGWMPTTTTRSSSTSGSASSSTAVRQRASPSALTGRSSRRSNPSTGTCRSRIRARSTCTWSARPTPRWRSAGPGTPPRSAPRTPSRTSRSTCCGASTSPSETSRSGSSTRTSRSFPDWSRNFPRTCRAGRRSWSPSTPPWTPSTRVTWSARPAGRGQRSPGCWRGPRTPAPTGSWPSGTPTSTRPGCGRCARRSASAPAPSPTSSPSWTSTPTSCSPCSSAQQYAWIKEYYPELFERIRRPRSPRAGSCRSAACGSESDTNMPGGEAMARQFVARQAVLPATSSASSRRRSGCPTPSATPARCRRSRRLRAPAGS